MKKINTFYLTILSVITPLIVSYGQASNASIENVSEAVTIDPSDLPEDAIDVGTIGPDTPSIGSNPSPTSGAIVDTAEPEPLPSRGANNSGLTVEEVVFEDEVAESSEALEAIPDVPEIDNPDMEIDFSGGDVEFSSEDGDSPDLAMADDETISVDFPDEEVRTIIRNVAELYDLNVVIPQGLEGRSSIKLRNVTWRQVFEVVLEPLDHTYIEDRNIIKVLANADLETKTDTRVFPINYAVASKLQSSLNPLIDAAKGGRIQVDERTNTIIITERPTQLNEIAEIIERLDRENPQVLIESKFIQITNLDQTDIGLNWSSLKDFSVTVEETAPDAVVEGSVSFDRSLGRGNNPISDTTILSASGLGVVMSALDSLSNTTLINNPTVVTLDGEEALIAIGERYPIPSYTYNDERGTFEVSGFEYIDIGINLAVRPHVNNAGFIRLSMIPEVSSRGDPVNFGSQGNTAEIPIINSTRTETEIILKDGHTLAIGGLLESEDKDSNVTVPFLSDIPVLGRLFKDNTVETDTRNLIIFVTASILNPDGTTYRDIIDPRLIHKMGLTDSDIPGYEIPDKELRAMEEIRRLRNEADRLKTELKYQAELDSLNSPESEDDVFFRSR